MGIPSYYRTLVRTYPHLVRRCAKPIDWLWMDYNCLIYHCLRRPDLRPYPGLAGQDAWERELIQAIVAYTQKVATLVKPTQGVYIGIDGVVPMAKMKQQRLRRFKSSWITANAVVNAVANAGPQAASWDTNAITPGTAFMGLVRRALEALVKTRKGWVLSSSDEPGEGEHKVMEQIRTRSGPTDTHAIYGLDADLVVLSLLTQDTLRRSGATPSLVLFREEIDMGTLKRDAEGEEVFQWFSIDVLRDILATTVSVRDYCFAMTLLGNDFLPSSLSFKVRDGGHDELLRLLSESRVPLLQDDDTLSTEGLAALLGRFASLEEARLTQFLVRKGRQALPPMAVGEEQWPLAEQAEAFLLHRGRLVPSWRALTRSAFPSSTALYTSGLHWVWDYYRGLDVCYNWYYPWALPPLRGDLKESLSPSAAPPVALRKGEISTAEQLCLVLPPSSAHLLPSHRTFQQRAPEFFPTEFHFDSVGKHFFWECEAEIPIPSLLEVKRILGRV